MPITLFAVNFVTGWFHSLPVSLPSPVPLQALVQKGEKRHLFDDTMPAAIQHKVNEDNLQFMRHRDVYCTEYFDFVRELVYANNVRIT